MNSSKSGQGQIAGSYEHGNELFDSVKIDNILTTLATTIFSRMTLLHGVSLIDHQHVKDQNIIPSFARKDE
jgi:hypothetical protein